MTQRQVVVLGGVVGAVAGMAVGYAYFTPGGRRWRRDAERTLSALMQEAERLLSAADQVRHSVAELRAKHPEWPRTA